MDLVKPKKGTTVETIGRARDCCIVGWASRSSSLAEKRNSADFLLAPFSEEPMQTQCRAWALGA